MQPFEDDDPSRKQLGYLLGRAALLKDRLLDKHLTEVGITAAQLKVLANIALGGMQRPSDLCQLLNIDSGAMTRMLDRLEKKALIVRRREAQDRRMIRIGMTAKGDEVVTRSVTLAECAFDELTEALSDAEFLQLTACLQKMLASAGIPPHFPGIVLPDCSGGERPS